MPTAALASDEKGIQRADCTPGMNLDRAETAASFEQGLANVADDDVVQYRLDQQSILADFGLEALKGMSIGDLQQRATILSAKGMRARFCKLLHYLPDEDKLLVCAGTGWGPGIVGQARVGSDFSSPAGYAFRTGKPVISNHLGGEEQFRTPAMLIEHGIRRAINVLVVADGQPWGVLEVDSKDDGRFDVTDVPFLQGFANLLGVAIERHRAVAALNEACAHKDLLIKEGSHRIKNSLALVSSLLHLQAKDAGSDVRAALGEAAARIGTISAAHDLLWRSDASGEIDTSRLLRDLVTQIVDQAPGLEIDCATDTVVISADRAIAVGLLVTELLTNAAKHAYDDGRGRLELASRRLEGDRFEISVRDFGRGLPEGFRLDNAAEQSLGLRMIRSLTRQLRGEMTVSSNHGAQFTLVAPMNANA